MNSETIPTCWEGEVDREEEGERVKWRAAPTAQCRQTRPLITHTAKQQDSTCHVANRLVSPNTEVRSGIVMVQVYHYNQK